MGQAIAVAIGGAIGSVLRFQIGKKVQALASSNFPYGVFLVNITGCFLIGILTMLLLDRFNVSPIWRAAILIGFLGGYTTFSSFTNDAINLLRTGQYLIGFLYIFSSLILSLLATWIGLMLGRII